MRILLILLLIFTVGLVVAESISTNTMKKMKPKEKLLKSRGATQLHQQTNHQWLSSSSGYCEIWRKDEFCELVGLTGYRKGDLTLEGTVINGGYFQYDYKKEQFIEKVDYVEAVKTHHFGGFSHSAYEVKTCVFNKEKERVVLFLQHRPTRIPDFDEGIVTRQILALLDNNTDSIMTILEIQEIQSVQLAKDYIIALDYNTIHIWNLNDGQKVKELSLSPISHIHTNQVTNNILYTTRNGKVFLYEIESDSTVSISDAKDIQNSFLLPNNNVLIVNKNNQCRIKKIIKNENMTVHYNFLTNAKVNDVFYDEKKDCLFIATEDRDFPIMVITGL